METIIRPYEIRRSVTLTLQKVCDLSYYTAQHLLTPLYLGQCRLPLCDCNDCCYYSHFHFVLISLTVDFGILVREVNWILGTVPITVPRWNSLRSWEWPVLSKVFVEAVCLSRYWFYICMAREVIGTQCNVQSIIWMGKWTLLAIYCMYCKSTEWKKVFRIKCGISIIQKFDWEIPH